MFVIFFFFSTDGVYSVSKSTDLMLVEALVFVVHVFIVL